MTFGNMTSNTSYTTAASMVASAFSCEKNNNVNFSDTAFNAVSVLLYVLILVTLISGTSVIINLGLIISLLIIINIKLLKEQALKLGASR